MQNLSFHANSTLRFTALGGGNNLGAYINNSNEQSSTVSGQIGIDEFVLNGNNGTLATFQDSPSLINLLNGNEPCSFII